MNSSNMSTKLNVIKYNNSGEFITESLVSINNTMTSINIYQFNINYCCFSGLI